MQQAIDVLRSKGIALNEEEARGVCIAILLHDIGHGPFSHTLEHTLMPVTHESVSLYFMESLNKTFEGRLSLAIKTIQRPLSQALSSSTGFGATGYGPPGLSQQR
jgi:HD superfamily phosphohydrolase